MAVNGDSHVAVSGDGRPGGMVRIDRDILPVWETEVLPDWVVHWLIPMLSAGQKWPEASESGLSELAQACSALAAGTTSSVPQAGSVARTVVAGWTSPATANFVIRAKQLYGQEGGMAGVAGNAQAYSQQAHNFAVETQYSKISINVAFWVTVVAIAIAIVASFFTAGSTTAIIGPYAAGARAAIQRILVRLLTVGARELGARRLARVTALTGATGRGAILRLLASPIGRELVEEIGEEFFIDFFSQLEQQQLGTTTEWDWRKSGAAVLGAGTGAVTGTSLAGPMARVTRSVPGFAGRALTTGLTNTIASPVGSFIANGVIYKQWEFPFTGDAVMGGFFGGVGRTGSISPFNPEVYTALAHPATTLMAAYDTAARTDAARAAGHPPGGPPGNMTPGESDPTGGQPGGQPGAVRSPEPAPARGGGPTTTTSPNAPAPRPGSTDTDQQRRTTTTPDTDTDQQRRNTTTPEADADQQRRNTVSPDRDNDDSAAVDPEQDDQTAAAPAPDDAVQTPAQTTDTTAQTPDGETAQDTDNTTAPTPDNTTAQAPESTTAQAPDSTADVQTQSDGATQPDNTTQTTTQTTTSAANLGGLSPAARAELALTDAFSDVVVGPDGDMLVAAGETTVGAISARTVARIRASLEASAEQGTDVDTLKTEAAALLRQAAAETSAAPAGDQQNAADPDTGTDPAPETHTSKPGTTTVASSPVADTRYVTDGRQGVDLQQNETLAPVDELRAAYFGDLDVVTISLTGANSDIVVVETKNNGTHYFQSTVGGLSAGLMGQTDVRTGGTDADHPHLVHFNPRVSNDQVARIWVHEIAHTLQLLAARGTGRRGFLRGRPDGQVTEDACVAAQVSEMALLTDQWNQADTLPKKRLLAVDIDGLARAIERRGHTAPDLPWAPTQATRPPSAPAAPEGEPTVKQLRDLVAALTTAEEALQAQIKAKTESANDARKEARRATRQARKAARQRDSGRHEREQAARRAAPLHRATAQRHERIALAYVAALTEATRARQTYEQAATALAQTGRTTAPGTVPMADIGARLHATAKQHHEAYLEALKKALPQELALATGQPAGRLAHISALTDTVNEMLKGDGNTYRFTVHELERRIRADWHKAMSTDGLVLRVGEGSQAAEVRVKLTLADLVEVIDPAVKASEMMVGLFVQSSRTVTVTESGSASTPLNLNSAVLTPLIPNDDVRQVAEWLSVGVGGSMGRNWSATSGAGMYAQTGTVSDNRSESLLFSSAASWTVEIRSRNGNGWRNTTTVDSGKPGDVADQRLWVSHSYTDQPPSHLSRISEDRRNPEMPTAVPESMTGLEEALDLLAATLGGDYTMVGTPARDALRVYVTAEMPHLLRDMVNGGHTRVLSGTHGPDVKITAKTEVVLEEAEPLGGPTAEEWEEEVLVDFAAWINGASSGGSIEGNVSAGFKHPALEGVNGPGTYEPTIGPGARGSRSGSRSYSSGANKQAIHPSVHRKTSPKQAYRLVLKTTFTVEEVGKQPVTLAPITHEAVVSMRESLAYHFGLPVDSAALLRRFGKPLLDADGNQLFRGEPLPGPPPGRKAELPTFMGDGPGQIRGPGAVLVQDVEDLDPSIRDVVRELRELGIIPPVVNGELQYSSNLLGRASQVLNLQELTVQLSEQRIRSGYDAAVQDGIFVDLVTHGLNVAPGHHVLRLRIVQDFESFRRNPKMTHTDAETVVNLDIGNQGSGRSISQSRTYGGGASVSEGDGPNQGQDGLSHEVGVSGGGNRTRSVGSNDGSGVSVVGLHENKGPVAIAELKHRLVIDLLQDGEETRLSDRPGSAKLLIAADLLPPTDGATRPTSLGPMSEELRAKVRLLAMDVPGLLDAASGVTPGAPVGSAAYLTLATALSQRMLVANPRLLFQDFGGVIVQGGGMPSQAQVSMRGRMGETQVLGIVDQVNGEILFGMGIAGVSAGGSSGLNVGASASMSDLDDGGTSRDGGKLSLPSRSGGTSVSTSQVDLWADEELTIKHGRQYVLLTQAAFTVTGSESTASTLPQEGRVSGGDPRQAQANGMVLSMIAEYEALDMYAKGTLDLPPALVSDAIERFLNDSSPLDPTLAVPLVQRYICDVAAARVMGEDVSYAARHTAKALLNKVREITGLGPKVKNGKQAELVQQLAGTLTEAAELIERARDVEVAPSYDQAVGIGTVESLDLTDAQGTPVSTLDAVLNEVEAKAPGVLANNPLLREEVTTDFTEDSVRIHVDDLWSRRGYEKHYRVQGDSQVAPTEEVIVRARLVPKTGQNFRRARLLLRTLQAGIIRQRYRYSDYTRSESYSGSYSAGVETGSGNQDGEQKLGVSTDRSRSYSRAINRQQARLQRVGLFNGIDVLEQEGRLVIEVVRRPIRPTRRKILLRRLTGRPAFTGPISAAARLADIVLRRRRRRTAAETAIAYNATLRRRSPIGFIRPYVDSAQPFATVTDPRQVELHPGFFPVALWEHPTRPTLLDVVLAELTRMLDPAAVQERESEFVTRLSRSALLTALERMISPGGEDLVPVSRQKFRDQGVQTNVQARLSDRTIVAGPIDDIEVGEANRAADAQNVTVSRGRVAPVGTAMSAADADSGLSGSVQAGEQVSESVTDHHGARRERSKFVKGKGYIVRFRVDYDLTFRYVARLRDGNWHTVGDPVSRPSASGATIDVLLLGEELEELDNRMEGNIQLGEPRSDWDSFRFTPSRDAHGLIPVLHEARLAARERGEVAHVAVREADSAHPHGRLRRFLVTPTGSVLSEQPDGGFAMAFSTLPQHVLNAAQQAGINLRDLFMNSETPGTFTQQVLAELKNSGVFATDVGKPSWPTDHRQSGPSQGGSVSQGIATGTVSDPAIEGTPFSRSARPDGAPDLTMDEVRAADVTAGDLGGTTASVTWVTEDTLVLQIAGLPDQHVRVLIEDPGAGLIAATEQRAGTKEDPHRTRIWDVHPDVLASVLVHELSHVAQTAMANAAQGVIRPSLSENQAEGTDLCLLPRLDEHAHLSRRWRAAGDSATRALLADAIDAIAADIERRGHTPPAAPWGTGPRAPAPAQPQSRIARLLNGGAHAGLDTTAAGLARLAQIAGVADVAQAPGAVGEYSVTTPRGTFTLALSTAPAGVTEVTVTSRTQDRLAVQVPAGASPAARIAVAEQVAAHAAALAGRPGTAALGPDGRASGPVLGVPDARTLARLRGLIAAIAEGSPLRAAADNAALRAAAEQAGLAPGRPGSAHRMLALARAGELNAAEIAAVRGDARLPETAAAKAMERAAALMGARVHSYGSGLMDIVLPGRAPIPVEVRPAGAGPAEAGLLTYQVDGRLTIGATERAAAATAAAAVARALGAPAADHAEQAELYEAVRQARAATAAQRAARLGVLFDLITGVRPEVRALLPAPVATELATLANGRRPRDWTAFMNRLVLIANGTGWYPEWECPCPADGPCVCGQRAEPGPADVQERPRSIPA
ncbi:cell envelope integrity protein TolA [Nonomuraea sp. NPDC002799]